MVSIESLGSPSDPMFVFITPLLLASGAGMQLGFESAQMCVYLRIQMCPDVWLCSVWVGRALLVPV